MSAATIAKIVAQILQQLADEKSRKRLGMILLVPVVGMFVVLMAIQYILSTPFNAISQFFQGDDATYAQGVIDDEGYFSNTSEPFAIGDYANVDATDPEQFKILLEYASQFIGRKYVWGGSTPETGFDCSGFICHVYTFTGTYNLPRTTAQGIFNQCTPITREEAKAGDLIFFQGTYNSDGPVSHIGMYLGDAKMLHSGDPLGITSIDTKYWSDHFLAFGRLGGVS